MGPTLMEQAEIVKIVTNTTELKFSGEGSQDGSSEMLSSCSGQHESFDFRCDSQENKTLETETSGTYTKRSVYELGFRWANAAKNYKNIKNLDKILLEGLLLHIQTYYHSF